MFADLADHDALSIVLAEASHSTHVDLVFDVYDEACIRWKEWPEGQTLGQR